jgi:hypothetical protein
MGNGQGMAQDDFEIAIPFFPSKGRHDADLHRLYSLLKALDGDLGRVHVFCNVEGCAPALPAGLKASEVTLSDEPDAGLPRGWLTAVRNLSGRGRDVVVLDYRQDDFTIASISRVIDSLRDGAHHAVASVAPSEDHPCQFNRYFNILRSEFFVVTDPFAHEVRGHCAGLMPDVPAISVSKPFPFSWSGRILDTDIPGGLYLVVNAETDGGLAKVAPGDEARPVCLRNVYLWYEDEKTARQIIAGEAPLRAMPLLTPPYLPGFSVLGHDGLWEIVGRDLDTCPSHLQLFPETVADAAQSMETAIRTYKVLHRVGSSGFGHRDWICSIPPLRKTSVFMINMLVEAQPPYADLELPYIPSIPAWHVDPMTLQRNLLGGEQVIHGRQNFPEVFHLSGGVVAFSASVLTDPLAAVRDGGGLAVCSAEGEMLP